MNEILGILGILLVLGTFIYGVYVVGKPHNFTV